MKLVYIFFALVFFQTLTWEAQAQTSVSSKESARTFVQKFYDWYAVLYNADTQDANAPPTALIALNKKAGYFEAPLRKALIDDMHAQVKSKGEIVGFDADPFLNAQDVGFTYKAGKIKQSGNSFIVEINSRLITKIKEPASTAEVVVIAEVVNKNNQWKFKNFFYPSSQGTTDLLKTLNNLHRDRIKLGV